MSTDDRPEDEDGQPQAVSTNGSEAQARSADNEPTSPDAHEALQTEQAPRDSFWRGERSRVPARGLILTIPVGVALWAIAVHILAKLL